MRCDRTRRQAREHRMLMHTLPCHPSSSCIGSLRFASPFLSPLSICPSPLLCSPTCAALADDLSVSVRLDDIDEPKGREKGQQQTTKQTNAATPFATHTQHTQLQPHIAYTHTPPHSHSPLISSSQQQQQQHDGGAPTEIRTQAGTRSTAPHGHAAVSPIDQHNDAGGWTSERGRRGKEIEEADSSAACCVHR